MPKRPRVIDVMANPGVNSLGLCNGDASNLCNYINSATERLLYAKETGDTGWIGGWAEMAFTITQDVPYIVAPFDVIRLENIDICFYPVPIQNQFYEYLRFGFGKMPKHCMSGRCSIRQAYDRGIFPTWTDITPPNKKIRIFSTDAADVDKRVLLQGLDNNSQRIYSLDGTKQVQGKFYDLANDVDGNPTFVDSDEMSKITGIQKDITLGQVTFYEYDTDTGDTELILTMEPGETVAGYRRYFVDGLPRNCCENEQEESDEVQVTAIAKLDYVPVRVATDYLLIPSIEALLNECQSVRYDRQDDPESKKNARYHHQMAVRLLQGQSIHEQGKESAAILFSPFGNARLRNQMIGLQF
jgi:hypothetical protein